MNFLIMVDLFNTGDVYLEMRVLFMSVDYNSYRETLQTLLLPVISKQVFLDSCLYHLYYFTVVLMVDLSQSNA